VSASAIHRNILENMRDGVMSIDLNGRVTTFNAAAEEILGLDCQDVIGRTLVETILELPGSDDFVQVILDAIYESSVTHHRRVTLPLGTQTRRLAVTTSFLFEGDEGAGERKGVVAVFSDVTEVERLRDEVRDMAAFRVDQLVRAHRERGHVMAALDPLEQADRHEHPELDPSHYGISGEELDERYAFEWGGKPVRWPLRRILDELRTVYCGSVGTQYMHIDDLEIQAWLRERLEGPVFKAPLSREKQLRILRKLSDAEVFETFLQSEFSRAKRFSLEGGETLIPLLDQAIEKAADQGVTDIVVGMSHRGRLNVLANILGIDAGTLFRRFERFDSGDDADCDGDVRFHLGVEAERECANGRPVQISLCFNPSHLEFVGPVVMGRARARQDSREHPGDGEVLPLVVHGDAAFAGQGVVQEMLNLSRLDGYQTGGTVHVILNNQIGFTTQPWQSRSTQYPSDVARMLQVPVFHVNGEQPEAVDRVIRLALDFRKNWRRDVVVDMYCYRRRGHMELDDPSCTQPLLYQTIESRPPIRETYTANLLRLGNVSAEEAAVITNDSRLVLDKALAGAAGLSSSDPHPGTSPVPPPAFRTPVSREELVALLSRLGEVPNGFMPHPKVAALARRRQSMASGKTKIDWATGEALAYATLLRDGHSVRVSGQDSERGTFAHRHAVLHDAVTGDRHVPLACLGGDRYGRFSVQNSPLTETAVMGFEFGYSIEARDDLVIWEAQFGDFANVAQVIIDQFVVSSEAKWRQPSGLVLLLPHGLEGQGPEHSSARPERFLQLCAEGNIEVAYLSTASQVFHRLRYQVLSPDRRPLVAFTPKKMLQSPRAASSMEELCSGGFQPVIADDETTDPVRILLCAGQLGAEIRAERKKRNSPVAVIRLERLYPFPADELAAVVEKYPSAVPVVWVQEEPENMGAWHWLRPRLEAALKTNPIDFVARPERASPATGSLAIHQREQQAILERAFGVSVSPSRRVPESGVRPMSTGNQSKAG
jgi:2-oxoglutarate dehydrogenase E1 component